MSSYTTALSNTKFYVQRLKMKLNLNLQFFNKTFLDFDNSTAAGNYSNQNILNMQKLFKSVSAGSFYILAIVL